MLTRLRIGFSHLGERKFRKDFRDKLNPLCSCGIEIETTTEYFVHCHFHNLNRAVINDLENIPISFSTVSDKIISLYLHGNGRFDDTKNRKTLMSTIRFIQDSQRFDE